MSEKDPTSGLSLESIKPPKRPPAKKADSVTRIEGEHLKKIHALERKSIRQDIDERKFYAEQIYRLVSFWLAAIFYILLASGWRNGWFQLSDKVLIALLGGTTINVLGLFVIVAKYLFPSADGDKRRRQRQSV